MSAGTPAPPAEDDWMVQTAAQAAPALAAHTVDTLRRYLAPTRTVVTPKPVATQPARRAA